MLLILILTLAGLMYATGSYSIEGVAAVSGVSKCLGYLLLSAFFVGLVFKKIRLPKLTGYLATGIIVGPRILNLVSESTLGQLKLVSGVATALIALTAGTELSFRMMRGLLRPVMWISGLAVIGTMFLLGAVVMLARSLLPFMAHATLLQAAAISLLLGVVISAQSPAVVVALRDETNAEGPLARTVLGVVVLADLIVVMMFAVATAVTKASLGSGAGISATMQMLGWEILGSLFVGLLLGVLLALFLRYVPGGASLFILALCVIIAEVGRQLAFDPLLVALAAGMFVRNCTKMGDTLHHNIESSALPVYVVFFAVAGASIHLDVIPKVWAPALLFIGVRAGGFLVGARAGATLAGAPEVVRRFAGVGLLPQAGLALALALLFSRTFPEFGEQAGALILAIVAINEVVAPAFYRAALVASGEAGKGTPEPTDAYQPTETDEMAPSLPLR